MKLTKKKEKTSVYFLFFYKNNLHNVTKDHNAKQINYQDKDY